MITDKLYPNSITRQGFSLTNAVSSFTSSGEFGKNIFYPYTMGYIPYEIYPKFYSLGVITPVYSSSENKLIFQTLTSPDNHAWGYCAHTSSSYTGNSTDFYVRYSNSRWKASQFNDEVSGIRLINSGYLASYTLNNYFSCTVVISETRDGGVATRGTYTNNTGISTVSDFNQFCKGEKNIVINYNANSYSISINDFNERGYATKRKVSDDATLIIGICQFKSICSGSGNSSSSPYLQIYPWIEVKQDVNSEIYSLYQCGACLQTMAITGGYVVINIGNGTSEMTGNNQQVLPPLDADARFFYGIEGELTYEEASAWADDNSEDYQYVESLNCFRRHSSGGQYYSLIPCIHPKEIKTILDLRLKFLITSTGQSDYPTPSTQYSNSVEVNVYNSSDTPTGNILNGDYSTIVSRLRPWQLWESSITTNTFNPSDIPPYVPPPPPPPPPPPSGDGNTESGDKIPNQFGRTVGVTSNFVTNYLMTEGQISKLGEVLWTSWADDTVTMDMVNNFYGKFHDSTGSWNVSDALQFIVACRLFPCSLATLVSTTQVTSIPIGTGAFALQCGTQSEPNFFIANEATAILNCGDLYVPQDYNDYRDYENTKITAYLPFCGSVELNPQDVVGKWLGCTYAIDLFDGSCKAFIYTLSGDDVGYEGAYYNVAIKQGQCGFLIPMSATQAGQVASRQKVDGYTDGALLFNAGMAVIGGAMEMGGVMGGSASPIYGGGVESTTGGAPVKGALKTIGAVGNYGFASEGLSAQRMGRPGIAAPYLSGGSGFTDFHQPASPYIQIRRSYYQEPLQYEHSVGYPTNGAVYDNLSQFTGFVKCINVDISGFTCHEDERSEIKALLESGIYL